MRQISTRRMALATVTLTIDVIGSRVFVVVIAAEQAIKLFDRWSWVVFCNLVNITNPLFVEVVLQGGPDFGLTSAVWFPNSAQVLYIQVKEVAKRRKAAGGGKVR